jgi:hypothetical protein
MPTLIITATHKTYNGSTFGVKFEEGRAVLNEHSNANRFGYSLEQLKKLFTTDLPGYSVEWIGDPEPEPVFKNIEEGEGEVAVGAPGGERAVKPVKAKKRPTRKATPAHAEATG